MGREPFIPGQIPESPLWSEKCHPFFGLPLSFTRYILYSDRLLIESGFLTHRQEELRLYRITDISLRQTLFQRMFGLGTIRLTTYDASSPNCFLRDIPHSKNVTRLISDLAEEERSRVRVAFMEYM